jgi:hypothetical protein
VKDPHGAPIAGARLRPSGSADAQGRWETEQDGTASFAFPATGLRETRFLVQATGFAPATSPPFTPKARESIQVNVVLDPGHRVTGRAQWKNGEPAATAIYALDPAANLEEVLPHLYGKPHHSQVPAPFALALTQADGSFELRVPAGAPQQLVGPRMAAGTPAILAIRADARDVTFVFPEDRPAPPPGGAVEGTVVEEGTGAPVIRFAAKLVAQDTERGARRVGPGRFRASSIPPGRWRLKVIPDDRAPVEQDVEVVDGKIESVVMKVSSGVTLKGRVVPIGSLRLDGGFLTLTPRGSKDEHLGRIRADGTFEITGLRPGSYSARFLPWDPMGAQGVWVLDDPSDVELAAASVQEREFRVTKGGTLYVHVRSGSVIDLWRRKDTLTGDEKAAFAKSLFEIRDSSGRVVASATGFSQNSFSLKLGTYEVLVDVPGAKPRKERVVLDQDEVTVPFDF